MSEPGAIIRDPSEQLTEISARIEKACQAAGRGPESVTLVAVAKRQSLDRITRVLAAGHRVFAENRIQEAQAKWPDLKTDYGDIELHYVGALQTNKVGDAFDLFDVIHTLDREKLARKIAQERDKRDGHCPDLFIQINTGEEPQKSGVLPQDVDAFVHLCKEELCLPVIGLMCLPPVDEEPALHFSLLHKFAKRHGLEKLSMGMSGDFETAIEFGATHVRIGTELFGPREG